jgi:N-acyl-D-amino-acid deacylase
MTQKVTSRTHCDLLLENARLIDGEGGPSFDGAVAIGKGRIVGIGPADQFAPRSRRDLSGLAIAPGFIDAHTHDDAALLDDPDMVFKTSQGVTTVITGNCGVSLAPLVLGGGAPPPSPLSEVGRPESFRFARFVDYLDALAKSPAAVNAAHLVGHTTLRTATMPSLDRPAQAGEAAAMAALCREALDAGAIGVSSGLFYPPAFAAPAEEVVPLAALAAERGGVYAAHIRDEADHVTEALEEAFAIAYRAGAPLIISHHKLSGLANFGRSRETLSRIAQAAAVHPVGLDVYPYNASSTMLNVKSWQASERVLITWSTPHPEFAGMELSQAAQHLGIGEREALDLLSPGGAIYFMMDEADVRQILCCPDAMIGSDGVPGKEHPHPRLYGTFPRVLGHYARDIGLFSLEEAVRRMTSLPARRFRLGDRGVLRAGAAADLVIFDPATVLDQATFSDPKRLSVGIDTVFVNGVAVFADGAATGARPGVTLRHSAGAVQ